MSVCLTWLTQKLTLSQKRHQELNMQNDSRIVYGGGNVLSVTGSVAFGGHLLLNLPG
jgi:hypothetical protein